jgi:hypothetical protein
MSAELIGEADLSEKSEEPTPEKPDLESRIAQLEAKLEATTEKANYWKQAHDEARSRQTTSRLPTDSGDEPEEPESDELDLVEVIAGGSKKEIKAALAKLGFVSKDEVEGALNNKWAEVETAASVQARHPEILDQNSEFHQETLRQVEGLRSQGFGKNPNLLAIAADLAYANLARAGKISRPSNIESDQERFERIGAQMGPSASRRRNPSEGSENEDLSPSQKFVAQKFGIPEATYKKRAQMGVRLAGVPKGATGQ